MEGFAYQSFVHDLLCVSAKNTGYQSHSQDTAWKDLLDECLEEFLAFFFPKLYDLIDFTKGYEMLDKELPKIVKNNIVGKRFADKLVKVYTKEKEEKVLLVHVEVQSTREKSLEQRLFVYNYRIFDKFRKPVITALVLADTDPNYRPKRFHVEIGGFSLNMEFLTAKILDYDERMDELQFSENPFSIVILACLEYIKNRNTSKNLYTSKRKIILQLLKSGYTKRYIRILLRFIDWVLQLPKELEDRLTVEIENQKGERTMPYVTSWERRGIEKGIEKGVYKKAREAAKKMDEKKYPIEEISEITGLTIDEIKKLREDQK